MNQNSPKEIKDLTGLLEYSASTEKSEESESLYPALEESPIEPIESFEGLEQIEEFASDTSIKDVETEAPSTEQQLDFQTEREGGVDTLGQVKEYSENLASQSLSTSAALPFTLRITGKLLPQEKEKLLDIISREKIDIRELDLEPQLSSGKVLLPRISEYAGIVLIQALKGVQAEINLYLAEKASSSQSEESVETSEPSFSPSAAPSSTPDEQSPANEIPVTIGNTLPGMRSASPKDVVMASALISAKQIEDENSQYYLELVELLKQELKHKAYFKKATGIIHFRLQTQFVAPGSTQIRIIALGTLVKTNL